MFLQRHAFFCLILFVSAASFAKSEETKSFRERLTERNKRISRHLDIFADTMDEYLAGDEYTKKRNKSQLILRNGVDWSEGGEWDYSPHVDFSLHLPHVEEKWKLRFTSYDTDEEEGIRRRRLRTATRRREDYGASLILFKQLGDFDVEFRPRLKISEKVEISHLLRFRSDADVGKLNVAERFELFGRPESGAGELFSLDLVYELSKELGLWMINEEEYVDKDNLFSTNHGVGVLYEFHPLMHLRPGFLVESNNQRDFRMQQYTVFVAFHHRFYKNVLHYSLTPRLAFPREERFSGHAGLFFELDLIF